MRNFVLIAFFFAALFISCDEKDCPDDMEECTVNGQEICVPKGNC